MERKKTVRRSTSKRLTFLGPVNLLAWLDGPEGAAVKRTIEERWFLDMRSRLFDGSAESEAIQAEVLERSDKTTPAVVVAEPLEDGRVNLTVYGPKRLSVKFVTLPVVPQDAALQQIAEQMVEVELPRKYQPYFASGCIRGREIIEQLSIEEYCERERRRLARIEVSKVLDKVKEASKLSDYPSEEIPQP